MIAYTIGTERAYDANLKDYPGFKKVGRQPDYTGGWVWRTPGEVQDAAKALAVVEPYAAYVIELPGSWDECTYEDGGQSFLLVDAAILRKL